MHAIGKTGCDAARRHNHRQDRPPRASRCTAGQHLPAQQTVREDVQGGRPRTRGTARSHAAR
eukprot:1207613-Alexandrium_andersonii.AAC.1